ncbi:MAG: HupE/UreJ family protein, partial [Psychrosphaera sp.]|nr:HupE/UreJ family protein [Psychrosphaera sp.]
AFTLAHSVTLCAGALGIVSLPAAAVEASIALSIGFLAAEIIRKVRFNQSSLTIEHPWLVAFGFGLLHGLGFASAITGMPETDLVPAILFFNLGVELGQIIFIMLVMSIFYLLKRIFVLNMKYINMTTAYCVGSLGCFWFIQRSAPIFS